jgi:hypothetical protein
MRRRVASAADVRKNSTRPEAPRHGGPGKAMFASLHIDLAWHRSLSVLVQMFPATRSKKQRSFDLPVCLLFSPPETCDHLAGFAPAYRQGGAGFNVVPSAFAGIKPPLRINRSGWIRTSGPSLPKRVRYLASLHSVTSLKQHGDQIGESCVRPVLEFEQWTGWDSNPRAAMYSTPAFACCTALSG